MIGLDYTPILPCPFCGSEAKLAKRPCGFDDVSLECYPPESGIKNFCCDIECTDENCYLAFGAGWTFNDPEEAIGFWNERRANDR